MKYQITSTGNVILADQAFMDAVHPNDYTQLPDDPPPAPTVPQSVSMRQARLALLGAGLLSTVDAAIDAQAEPLKSQIEIEWTYATEIDRQRPTLLALAPALGLDSDDLDSLFIAASQL